MTKSASFVDYYELLGVSLDAEPAQIRMAFMKLAKEHHPDVGGSTEQMQLLTKAYKTLSTESLRRPYDLLHGFHTGNEIIRYHDFKEQSDNSSIDDMSDDDIDEFLDTLLTEYRAQPKSKKSLKDILKKLL